MSNIVSFSNMTIEEFVSLNIDNIPPELIKTLDEKLNYIKQLEDENEKLNSKNDLVDEQLYFARELISNIDDFAEENLSKPKLKKYNIIRENTYFEHKTIKTTPTGCLFFNSSFQYINFIYEK